MAKYRITNKAVEDLSDIWEYTLNVWSEYQADKYYKEHTEAFQFIAENPQLGKHYEHIITSIYGYLVNRHIVFYQKMDKNEILIVRLIHSSSDLRSRILE